MGSHTLSDALRRGYGGGNEVKRGVDRCELHASRCDSLHKYVRIGRSQIVIIVKQTSTDQTC